MPTLQEKMVAEYEGLPKYVPYGAHVKKAAEKLIKKKINRLPEGGWQNLQDIFSPEELALITKNPEFAAQMLAAYDPMFHGKAPTPQDIGRFQTFIGQNSSNWNPFELYSPADTQRIQQGAATKISENNKIGEQAERMLQQTSRLAPFNELHTTAEQMMLGNKHDETLKQGMQEIAVAGKTDVPREIAPYLARASESPDKFLKKYKTDYSGVIENFRKEAARDFLENDMPRINNQYAAHGAFYSGARQSALDKAKAHKEQRLESHIAQLLAGAHEKGMGHFHEHRNAALSQAQVAGHAHEAQRAARLQGAEALRSNSTVGQAFLNQNVGTISNLARAKQQQAQNELNVRQKEHAEEMERPYIELSRKAAIAGGFPHPQPTLSAESMAPPPPNAFGAMSGGLGLLAGLAGQPHQPHQQLSQGGHVRRGYAAGDSVARAASQLQQLRGHIQESPEEAEMRESAQSFKNHRANPMADYLMTSGAHQLANLHKGPMRSFGEGAVQGVQAFKEAQGKNLSIQDKYHNLLEKKNQSLIDQHQFLAKYHANMQNQEEMQKQHNIHNAEAKRGHDLMYAAKMAKLGNAPAPNPYLPQFSSKEEEKAYWREQTEARKEFRLSRKAVDKDINNFTDLKARLDEGIGETGAGIGILPNVIATWLEKPEIASNRFLMQKGLNEKILEMTGSLKGTQSDKDMAIIQGTVPSMSDTPLTFKKYFDKWGKIAHRAAEEKKFIDKEIKKGVPITQAQEEWYEYVNEHPLFAEKENPNQTSETFQGKSGTVAIIGPDGEEWMIPQENVQAAIEAGGHLA